MILLVLVMLSIVLLACPAAVMTAPTPFESAHMARPRTLHERNIQIGVLDRKERGSPRRIGRFKFFHWERHDGPARVAPRPYSDCQT